jgi:hypothetical protein
MSKANKFTYLFVIQGNYGYGWDDLTQSEDYREARADLRSYRENETRTPHRLIKRRELNEDYPAPTVYNVVRFHESKSRSIIKRGVTLVEAQAHCADPATSTSMCATSTRRWFDGYEAQ